MADENIQQIVKGGETRLQINISRNAGGLVVNVKAHKQIEEFMKQITGGTTSDLAVISRNWRSNLKDKPFSAYTNGSANHKVPPGTLEDGSTYSIDLLGQPLITQNGQINISFLRLQGISEDAGASFTIAGVYSTDAVRNIRDKVGQAARRFYIDYLRPMDFSVAISTQELRY